MFFFQNKYKYTKKRTVNFQSISYFLIFIMNIIKYLR